MKRTSLSAALLTVALALPAGAQSQYASGQNVAPSFDGWYENADGTFTLVFGYFSRNLEEIVDVPVGPENGLEPGGPDQGQPTHFFPRRNRYVFRVTVPGDFGKKEVVWTLTSHGRTEKAYASLRPEYTIDTKIMMLDGGSVGRLLGREDQNKPPAVRLDGPARRTVPAGEPLTLVAYASDDGIPNRKGGGRDPVVWGGGLRVAWYVYRGSGPVTFDPDQLRVFPDPALGSPYAPRWTPTPLPPDGKSTVTVTFAAPGEYVLRVVAHDGGLGSTIDIPVVVTASSGGATSRR